MRIEVTATTMTIDRPIPLVIAEAAQVEPGSAALLKLMTFLSPAFPVGGFAYSHGLEWAIESGVVRNAAALQGWLADLIDVGGAWNDAILFAEAYRAATAGDRPKLLTVAELGAALSPSRERHLETTAQGRAFLDAVASSWPSASTHVLSDVRVPYPVAVGSVVADHEIALEHALPAYLNAFTANLISVGVRLIPIGQNAGLSVLSILHPLIAKIARRTENSTLEDLGSATILADVASMRHEEQYSRVFRT